MRKVHLLLFALLFCLGFSESLFATHLMGGSVFYEYLGINNATGNYRYKITFKIYRYCDGTTADLDPQIRVGAYEENAASPSSPKIIKGNFIFNLTSSSFITLPGSTGCTFTPNVCVQEGIYINTIELPFTTGGYHLTFERCCRNNNIINLVLPGDQGQSYYAFIPPSFIQNNSPQFIEAPIPYICVNDTTSILNTVSDPDGDVLTYSLVKPFRGYSSPANSTPNPGTLSPYAMPIPTVSYTGGYTECTPFGTTGSVSIDSSTGLSNYYSPAQGFYVVAIEINEYRNNQLIGKTRRDMQIIVITCPPNNSPTSSAQINYTVIAGSTLCFPIKFEDANADSIYMSSKGDMFSPGITNPAATLPAVAGKDSVLSQFCWSTTSSQAGNYLFTVKAQDNGCPPKTKNMVYTIAVVNDTVLTTITTHQINNNLRVFPNPANDQINIRFDFDGSKDAEVSIYNILGSCIYSKKITEDGIVNTSIDLSDKSKGIYFLKIVTGKTNVVLKISLQ